MTETGVGRSKPDTMREPVMMMDSASRLSAPPDWAEVSSFCCACAAVETLVARQIAIAAAQARARSCGIE